MQIGWNRYHNPTQPLEFTFNATTEQAWYIIMEEDSTLLKRQVKKGFATHVWSGEGVM